MSQNQNNNIKKLAKLLDLSRSLNKKQQKEAESQLKTLLEQQFVCIFLFVFDCALLNDIILAHMYCNLFLHFINHFYFR